MDLSVLTIVAAISGGIFMFLAPCTLPLIPAFLSSLLPGIQQSSAGYTRKIAIKTIMFSIGFTVVFVTFGSLAGLFSSQVSVYRQTLSQIGGVIIILFGLSVLGLFQTPLFSRSTFTFRRFLPSPSSYFAAPLLGALFALGWTPCAGPILASIIFLASTQGSVVEGGVLLMFFSLGLFIPLILVVILYAHTVSIFRLYEKFQTTITRISGSFLVLIGFFIAFGNAMLMSSWGFHVYTFLGFTPNCSYF